MGAALLVEPLVHSHLGAIVTMVERQALAAPIRCGARRDLALESGISQFEIAEFQNSQHYWD